MSVSTFCKFNFLALSTRTRDAESGTNSSPPSLAAHGPFDTPRPQPGAAATTSQSQSRNRRTENARNTPQGRAYSRWVSPFLYLSHHSSPMQCIPPAILTLHVMVPHGPHPRLYFSDHLPFRLPAPVVAHILYPLHPLPHDPRDPLHRSRPLHPRPVGFRKSYITSC